MAWRRASEQILSEPMMVKFNRRIYVSLHLNVQTHFIGVMLTRQIWGIW